MSCVGSIGTIMLCSDAMEGMNIARAIARIPIDNCKADRVFVAQVLQSSSAQRYFRGETRTVAQPTLNIKQLKETPVCLPPLSLQQTFAGQIEELERIKARGRAQLSELDALFASLQERAFDGRL